MKKCNFLNPDKYEFLTWFFLGIALTTISWLIAVVIPELKSFNDIVKNGTDSLAIITTVSIFAILTHCKIIQTEKELVTKQIITCLKRFAFSLAIVLIITILWKVFHKKEDGFVLISALAVLISALLASYSMMLNIENTNNNEEKKKESEKSKFFLDKSIVGLNLVYEKLKDKNNDRVIWIHVARILENIKKIEINIILDEHKKVYEIEKESIKHNIRQVLSFKRDADLESMPLAFYMGKKDWETCTNPLQELNDTSIYSLIDGLSVSSIISIYEFIDFEEGYSDPLDGKADRNDISNWIQNNQIKSLIKPDLETYLKKFTDENKEKLT